MPHIVTLAEADAQATYYPHIPVWHTRLAAGAHQELNWIKFEPGDRYPMHSHPYEQTSILVQGRLRLTVGDEVRDIGPGDMWFVPANVPHGGDILGDDPVIFIDVYAPVTDGTDDAVTYL